MLATHRLRLAVLWVLMTVGTSVYAASTSRTYAGHVKMYIAMTEGNVAEVISILREDPAEADRKSVV